LWAGWRQRERDLAAVEELLQRRGGVLLIEGRAGIGKTTLVEVACSRAEELGHEVVRARGSELESGFAFGVVRQLFERRLASAGEGERATLLAGPAAAAGGTAAGMLVALRPGDPAAISAPLLALRAQATVLRPALLSEEAVNAMVRAAAGGRASDELCAAVHAACGGNPLYLSELLRAADLSGRPLAALRPAELLAGGVEGFAQQVITRVNGLGPGALGLVQGAGRARGGRRSASRSRPVRDAPVELPGLRDRA
jgi:hypothetical protein